MRLLPISGIVALVSSNVDFFSTQTTAITCLTTSPTLENLVTCLAEFTVPTGTYDATTYASAQPSTSELAAWTTVIASLLEVDGNCNSVSLPTDLSGIYTVSLFTESVIGGRSFCILSESNSNSGYYVRGWGLVAVPATRAAVSRNIHFSAPHPVNDSRTPEQATALFKRTGAKSLVITGRQRDAYKIASSCSGNYFKTDAAHDIVRHLIDKFLCRAAILTLSPE